MFISSIGVRNVLALICGDVAEYYQKLAQYYHRISYRCGSTEHKAVVVLSFLHKFVNAYINDCIIFILTKHIATMPQP
jgi:hypothetical protein